MQHVPLDQRLSRQILDHPLTQHFTFRSVQTLLAIERGDADLDEAVVRRVLRLALQACITADVMEARRANAPAASRTDAGDKRPGVARVQP
jgi:hypothetical protein